MWPNKLLSAFPWTIDFILESSLVVDLRSKLRVVDSPNLHSKLHDLDFRDNLSTPSMLCRIFLDRRSSRSWVADHRFPTFSKLTSNFPRQPFRTIDLCKAILNHQSETTESRRQDSKFSWEKIEISTSSFSLPPIAEIWLRRKDFQVFHEQNFAFPLSKFLLPVTPLCLIIFLCKDF